MTEVRRAGPDDWEAWRDLRLRSLADSPDAFGSTLDREQAFTREDWLDRLRSLAVLAFVDGVPVGLGSGFRIREGWVQVVAMWVEPAYRGRGLSRRILDLVVEGARAEGRRAALEVNVANPVARAAYLAYGFVPTGERGPLREGSDQVVEHLVLPG